MEATMDFSRLYHIIFDNSDEKDKISKVLLEYPWIENSKLLDIIRNALQTRLTDESILVLFLVDLLENTTEEEFLSFINEIPYKDFFQILNNPFLIEKVEAILFREFLKEITTENLEKAILKLDRQREINIAILRKIYHYSIINYREDLYIEAIKLDTEKPFPNSLFRETVKALDKVGSPEYLLDILFGNIELPHRYEAIDLIIESMISIIGNRFIKDDIFGMTITIKYICNYFNISIDELFELFLEKLSEETYKGDNNIPPILFIQAMYLAGVDYSIIKNYTDIYDLPILDAWLNEDV